MQRLSVLAVSALGETLPDAISRAYEGVERVSFEDAFYRRDIGQQIIHAGNSPAERNDHGSE